MHSPGFWHSAHASSFAVHCSPDIQHPARSWRATFPAVPISHDSWRLSNLLHPIELDASRWANWFPTSSWIETPTVSDVGSASVMMSIRHNLNCWDLTKFARLQEKDVTPGRLKRQNRQWSLRSPQQAVSGGANDLERITCGEVVSDDSETAVVLDASLICAAVLW